ncbi:MAG: hypothetical protein IPP32_16530 [Bacteroidetes bacterium]|nr:hypothetical protein [Bacteroidota bacterium]
MVKQLPNKKINPDNLIPISINKDATLNLKSAGPFFEIMPDENEPCRCPYCFNNLEKPFHFRLSASFLNRLMSDIILEQTNDASPITNKMLWSGKSIFLSLIAGKVLQKFLHLLILIVKHIG